MADADLIAIRMRLIGGKQVAEEAKVANKAIAGTGTASKDAAAMAQRSSQVTSSAFRKQAAMMQSTGRSLTYGLTLPLGLAGVMAIKTAADFTRTMAQIGVATGVGGHGLDQMKDLALEMGAKTIFSANDAAEAMLALGKSGIDPATIKAGALSSAMNLAATENIDLARSAEITAAAMNTFKLNGNESARIADALAGGANASSASVEGLALSLSQGGQSAAMYGLSLEETVGGLAAFAQNGIQASDAGTSLKTFLMKLNPTTKKAKELMNELGLNFFDSKGKMLSLAETSRVLNERLGDMNDKQRNAALGVLFGTDAIRAANIVYKEGPAGIMKYVRATEKRGGAEKMANAQMEGLPGALERAKGSLETAALVLGEALAPAIMLVAEHVEGLANAFTELPESVQGTIAVVAALAALAGPMLWFAGTMAKAVIAIRELRAAEAVGGGGMLGGKTGMMARLGVGVAGTAAAQIGGGAIGGDLGNWVNKAGTGAATGFMVGGPLGAAVGGAAGGVLAAVDKLTSGERRLTAQQQRLVESSKSVQEWWGRQSDASHGLVAADRRVKNAHSRADDAAKSMHRSQSRLAAVVSEYGAKSRPAIHAEATLTRKINAHRHALKQLENAERLRGVALSAYKTETNSTVLAERHRINNLTALRDRQARLFSAAKQANSQSARTNDLAGKLLKTEGALEKVTRRHGQTLADAASKGGQAYARFLQNASQQALRAGGQMKYLNEQTEGLISTVERLTEANLKIPHVPSGSMLRPGNNAAGTNSWRGGLTWLAERGAELVESPTLANVPRGARIHAAPATQRLLRPPAQPQPSARVAELSGSGGSQRFLAPIVIKVGRREIANVTVEAQEDAKARL